MGDFNKPKSVIVAGVGGQGAVTVAQLVLGACWRAGYYVLQSEVHGMSQRGGAVNANIIFDQVPVTSPVVTPGEADILIGIEPLETLRYLSLLSKDANIISSMSPVINMENYPSVDKIIDYLKGTNGVLLVDTEDCSKKLNYKHAGNMSLLGAASKFFPIENEIWKQVITERFQEKGEAAVAQNWTAFEYGRNL